MQRLYRQEFSSYLTGNTLRLRYRAQPVNAVWGNSRCLLWESYGTHKYTVGAECRMRSFSVLNRVLRILKIVIESVNITVFWDVMPCGLVDTQRTKDPAEGCWPYTRLHSVTSRKKTVIFIFTAVRIFLSGLFCVAVKCLDYTGSNGGMMNWRGSGRKRSWPDWGPIPIYASRGWVCITCDLAEIRTGTSRIRV
jgi:hypothetical protein